MGRLRPDQIGATAETFPLFRCPQCLTSGFIDEDQLYGRVSILCNCGYHQMRDWSREEG